MFDLLIKNGVILDGTGGMRFHGDVGIKGDKITAIQPHIDSPAAKTINAASLFVTPGFIDTHSHADKIVLFNNTSYNVLLQGITFQFMGQCGDSPVPYSPNLMGMLENSLTKEDFASLKEKVSSFNRFMQEANDQYFGVNVGFFLGHQALRAHVMGYKNAEPSLNEMLQMKSLLEDALNAGYWGMSTGLVYVPSVYASTEELIELSKVLAEHNGIYASHIRGEGDCVVESVAEAIRIGHESGAQVQISHLKVMGKLNMGKSQLLLDMIDQANRNGCKVYADQYPFEASSAPLICQIPPKYLEGGNDKAVIMLADKELRQKIEWSIFNESAEFESALYFSGYEGVIISEAPYTPEHTGKRLTELSQEQNKTPFDAFCDLLIENRTNVQGIYMTQNMEDIIRIMAHPRVFCGSDWAELPAYYEPSKQGGAHPRCIGTMTRRLEMVRNYGLSSAEEAIRSISGRVAEVFNIPNRGTLKVGNYADINVIDYNNIRCNADYEYPFRLNDGIQHVIVNGKLAVENGQLTGQRGGRVIKRDG